MARPLVDWLRCRHRGNSLNVGYGNALGLGVDWDPVGGFPSIHSSKLAWGYGGWTLWMQTPTPQNLIQ